MKKRIIAIIAVLAAVIALTIYNGSVKHYDIPPYGEVQLSISGISEISGSGNTEYLRKVKAITYFNSLDILVVLYEAQDATTGEYKETKVIYKNASELEISIRVVDTNCWVELE